MVTDKMVEDAVEEYAAHSEVSYPTDGIAMRAALEAALSASDAEPVCTVAEIGAGGYRMLATYPLDAINHLPVGTPLYAAPPAVAVKALEWTDEEWPRAKCIFGCYVINPDYRMVDLIVGHGGVSAIMLARIELSKYASDADLKAAAQADYEARVRAAIVSPADTSPVFTVAQIVEKIKDYGQDSMPTSEYRLACDDLVEAFEALAAATKEASHDD